MRGTVHSLPPSWDNYGRYNVDQLYRDQLSGKKEQKLPTGPDQFVFYDCLDLYHISPDSGERQCKSITI